MPCAYIDELSQGLRLGLKIGI